ADLSPGACLRCRNGHDYRSQHIGGLPARAAVRLPFQDLPALRRTGPAVLCGRHGALASTHDTRNLRHGEHLAPRPARVSTPFGYPPRRVVQFIPYTRLAVDLPDRKVAYR